MKRIILFLLIVSLVNFSASGQNLSLDNISPAPGTYIQERDVDHWYAEARELAIWTEEFDDGIPESWTNEEDGGIAFWEYRGPDTTPGIGAGSRGSCIPEEVTAGDPIQSETWANGFVIFDSNYWDDNIGPCGNLGAGPAPGPHYAYLTTESIDLSAYDKVGVLFTQYYKNWSSSTELQVSVNGGPWDTVISNVFSENQATELGQVERKNITEYVGGQSDVRLRFAFEGNYYFWMIDDIILFELDDNNLVVESSTFGNFNPLDAALASEMEKLEYSQYPDEMPPNLFFKTQVSNLGAESQHEVKFEVTITNDETLEVIYNDSIISSEISSDAN